MAGETCQVQVSHYGGWTSHVCGKPAKGATTGEGRWREGLPACGVHLAAERRVAENGRKRREQYDSRKVLEDRSRARAEALGVRLGVKVYARDHAGEISHIDLDAIADRLDRLARYEAQWPDPDAYAEQLRREQ